jgi:hypothetical protein
MEPLTEVVEEFRFSAFLIIVYNKAWSDKDMLFHRTLKTFTGTVKFDIGDFHQTYSAA